MTGEPAQAVTPIHRNTLDIRPLSGFKAERQSWLWDGMVPSGTLTLLAGPGGTSKSTLAIELAARLSRGELAGEHHGTPTSAFYLTRENDISRVVYPRFEAAGGDLSRIGVLGSEQVSLPDDTDELMRHADSQGARLIVLDTLVTFTGGTGSYSSAVRTLGPLLDACARRDIAVVAVHHTTKSSKKPSANAVLGSTGLTATARQVLLVGTLRDDAVVAVVKSNVGRSYHGWVYSVTSQPLGSAPDIEAPGITMVRPAMRDEIEKMYGSPGGGGIDDRVVELLTFVSGSPGVDSRTAREFVMETYDVRQRTAEKVIAQAVDTFLLSRTHSGGGGDYHATLDLTPAGWALLSDGGKE